MSLEVPLTGDAHATTIPPAPSDSTLNSVTWLDVLLARSTPGSPHCRTPLQSTCWAKSALGPLRPSIHTTTTPPAPSLTALGSICPLPAGATQTRTPSAVHCGKPPESTRRANTSKPHPRSSDHTAIAPPRWSETAAPTCELNAVVQSGTFCVGTDGHAASATRATATRATTSVNGAHRVEIGREWDGMGWPADVGRGAGAAGPPKEGGGGPRSLKRHTGNGEQGPPNARPGR